MAFITLFCVFYLATFLLLVILQTPSQKKTTPVFETEEEEEQLAAPPSNLVSSSVDSTIFERLKEIASLVEEGGNAGEVRKIAKAVRLTMGLRRKLINASVLSSFLNYASPGSYQLNGDGIIQVVTATQRLVLPELEVYCHLLLLIHLFYLGKIRTIQLEYTDAKECLLQAAQRAPVSTALGFRAQCNKWAVLVRLLLGEIPERTVFMQKGMERALRPYFELTNAVRIGDLELFKAVAEKFSSTFSNDRTNNVIVRLRHSVIRTGLRNISISYSRISLADVAEKLRLDSENAESIIAKAVRDGTIDAILDHANGTMICKEKNEPNTDFDSRISFCLDVHNEAVRALQFPKRKATARTRTCQHRGKDEDDDEL